MKLYKKMTKSGAVGIPVRLRRDVGMMPGDGVSVEEAGGKLVITPQERRCIFCGQTESQVQDGEKAFCIYFCGKMVCTTCMEQLEGRMAAGMEGGE